MRQDVKNRKIEQVLTHTKHSIRYLCIPSTYIENWRPSSILFEVSSKSKLILYSENSLQIWFETLVKLKGFAVHEIDEKWTKVGEIQHVLTSYFTIKLKINSDSGPKTQKIVTFW